jgi:hypothetical protein
LRRNCLLNQVIEGKIEGRREVTGRRGRRSKQLLDGLKQKRKGYCKLKEEALDCTVWRTGLGRGYGPVVRQKKEGKGSRCKSIAALILKFGLRWEWSAACPGRLDLVKLPWYPSNRRLEELIIRSEIKKKKKNLFPLL